MVDGEALHSIQPVESNVKEHLSQSDLENIHKFTLRLRDGHLIVDDVISESDAEVILNQLPPVKIPKDQIQHIYHGLVINKDVKDGILKAINCNEVEKIPVNFPTRVSLWDTSLHKDKYFGTGPEVRGAAGINTFNIRQHKLLVVFGIFQEPHGYKCKTGGVLYRCKFHLYR